MQVLQQGDPRSGFRATDFCSKEATVAWASFVRRALPLRPAGVSPWREHPSYAGSCFTSRSAGEQLQRGPTSSTGILVISSHGSFTNSNPIHFHAASTTLPQ